MNSEIKMNIRSQKPIVRSKTVFIRRKPVVVKRGDGDLSSEANPYVGSAFRNSSVLRGLDHAEEAVYLKNIVGISPDSDKWEAATKDYWANMRVRIPDGQGLSLEVGFMYENEEDAQYAEEADDYAIKQQKGVPIKLSDYILWRYCLVYRYVANSIDDVNASTNIRFYLFSKEEEVKQQHSALKSKLDAQRLYLTVIGNRSLVDDILTMFNEPVDTLSPTEKDLALDKYVGASPDEFTRYAQDERIDVKAFIERCIYKGYLKRYPNTQTIAYDTTVIGADLTEAVIFLTRPAGVNILNTLRAKMAEGKVLTPIAQPRFDATGTIDPVAAAKVKTGEKLTL